MSRSARGRADDGEADSSCLATLARRNDNLEGADRRRVPFQLLSPALATD